MQDKLLDMIREFSFRIDNGRTLRTIKDHASGEMDELSEELVYHEIGDRPGEDGVIGEAIDVILCLVDLIYNFNPSITNDEIIAIVEKKSLKWERIYGKMK